MILLSDRPCGQQGMQWDLICDISEASKNVSTKKATRRQIQSLIAGQDIANVTQHRRTVQHSRPAGRMLQVFA